MLICKALSTRDDVATTGVPSACLLACNDDHLIIRGIKHGTVCRSRRHVTATISGLGMLTLRIQSPNSLPSLNRSVTSPSCFSLLHAQPASSSCSGREHLPCAQWLHTSTFLGFYHLEIVTRHREIGCAPGPAPEKAASVYRRTTGLRQENL